MDQNIFRFILRFSLKDQLFLLTLTLLSFPFLYYSLELPKIIINDAIRGFEPGTAALGITFDQVSYLFTLCGLFLAMVVVNGVIKYFINSLKGQLGERMLRRLRYELYARVLRFPLPRFKKVSSGEIIPMITMEVEPLGGFIGDAIAQPAFQGGTLLVYLGFIFMQDWTLGLASIMFYPLQGYLIPRLQRRVNELGKQRVRTMRGISEKIGETVNGVQEIHNHDTSAWHLAEIADRYGDIYEIRFEIYRRKYFIKFLNNFINQLTPFFFYSLGGYLVIQGSLSFGALVAVLAAYKDLAGPWRELLVWYQLKEDARIKYEQVVEQFQPAGLLDEHMLAEDERAATPLTGALHLQNIGYGDDGTTRVLDGVTCEIRLDAHTAVLNAGAGGTDELAPLIARLIIPTTGSISIDGQDLVTLPETVTGRRLAYVGPTPFLFGGTLRDNLYYALRHRPMQDPEQDGDKALRRRRRLREALASGNSPYDIEADWTDYAAAGCTDLRSLEELTIQVLRVVDFYDEVYELGLAGKLDPVHRPDRASRVLAARAAVRARLADPELARLVEVFDRSRFNHNATVAENLLFGTPVDDTFTLETMAEHPYVRSVLVDAGLHDRFLRAGREVAASMVDIFSELPPGHELFERFSFIKAEDLGTYQAILERTRKDALDLLSEADQARLITLVLKLIPSRHRLGVLTDEMREAILFARQRFAAGLPDSLSASVAFFDEDTYNATATVQDNILFGRLTYGQTRESLDRVRAIVREVAGEAGLNKVILRLGLDTDIGVSGLRLSMAQRQKTSLARALLKNPDLLVINQATASLDGSSQARVHAALLEDRAGRGVVWFLHKPSAARAFDEVLILRDGGIVEQGPYAHVAREGSLLASLMAQE